MTSCVVVYNSMSVTECVIASALCNASLFDVSEIDVCGAVRAGLWDTFGAHASVFIALSQIGDLVPADFADSPYDCVYLPGEPSKQMLAPKLALEGGAARRCDVCTWYPPAVPGAVGYGGGLQLVMIAALHAGQMEPTESSPSVADARAFMYELESQGDRVTQLCICGEIRDAISGCDRIVEMTARGHGRLAERKRILADVARNCDDDPAMAYCDYIKLLVAGSPGAPAAGDR